MAYVRKEKETVEIDHSLDKVWTAIQKVLASLEWEIEQIDEKEHRVKTKTQSSLMSWGAVLLINAVSVDKNTTRVSVEAETPVTTITAMVHFGQTKQRIALFLTQLAKQLTK
jgi:hypothetical protein